MTPSPAPPTVLSLADAERILAAQPFSVLLGARMVAFGDGEAILELDARDALRQQNGHLHGGVLAYAADNTLTFAAGTALGPAVLTGGFTIDYLRPARTGTLRAHARVTNASRRQAVCRCDIHAIDADGIATLCAVAQGTTIALAPAG